MILGSSQLKVDALDRKILFELSINSRQGISALSRKVKHGRDIVEYRVERLVKEGVIRRFTASVNPYALGKTIYKSYLKLRSNPKKISDLLKTIKNSKQIYCYALCDGSWDLIYTLLASSPYEYSIIESNLVNKFKDIILSQGLGVIISYDFYPRKYLTTDKGMPGISIGGEPVLREIDSVDRVILSELSNNSRIALKDLSERAGISIPSVSSRMIKYESQNIIPGYRIDINPTLLGLSSYKAQLELFSTDHSSIEKVKAVCSKILWITKFIVQLGTPRVECNIEARDHEHFNQILSELKEKLSDILVSVSTVMIREEKVYGVQVDEEKLLLSLAA